MTYILHIADPAYSSWSMRAWLVADRANLSPTLRWHELYADRPLTEQLGRPPARQVPMLETPEGTVIRDSLAIAEELATRHPDAALWPSDPALRALARSLAAEMHSGFVALRGACPMVLRCAFAEVPVNDAVAADLARIETIWADALAISGGPWLAGNWSIADAFFAPVAARIAGYGLPVEEIAESYVTRQLGDDGFRRWRGLGLEIGKDLHETVYSNTYRRVDWPDPLLR